MDKVELAERVVEVALLRGEFKLRSGQTSASDGDGATAKPPKQTTTAPNVLATVECMITSSSARFTQPFFEEEARSLLDCTRCSP